MKYAFTSEPCSEGAVWLETQPDMETAWANCDRGDWMWWALRHSKNSMPAKKTSVAFANRCAERSMKYASDASDADYADAAYYANAAASDAASAADSNADYADYADAAASDAASAEASAAYYANAAASDAASSAYSAAADAAAERKVQADWIRTHCDWNG